MKIRILIALLVIFFVGCNSSDAIEMTATIIEATSETMTLEPTTEPSATFTPTMLPTSTFTPEPTATQEIQVVDSLVSEADGMVLVFVPAGEFEMGNEEGWESEQPVHTVNLNAFWIDQTEVSNHQYRLCVQEEACEQPGSPDSFTRDRYYEDDAFASHPVINVSWYDAQTYCEWAGRRLPTEAEWEKAARGVDGNLYPWGDNISCEYANYIGCVGDTASTGSYPQGASPYGALDMAGNVWEWVSDWYYIGYYKESPLDYPQGPESGAYRVVRGGSWNDYEWYLRTTTRYSYFPDNQRVSIGFRCALESSQ